MQFTIWLTYDCNMQCSYCYEGNDKKNTNLSIEDADSVLSFIQKMSNNLEETININLHGGEPLLNYEVLKHIVKKINSWNNKKVVLLTTTNGTLLDDEKINFLTRNFHELSLSIDGNETVHDENRTYFSGEGTFKDVKPHISKLLKKHPNVLGRITITPETAYYLSESVTFLFEQGFKTVVPIINQYDDRWSRKHLDVLYRELQKIVETHYRNQTEKMVGMIEEVAFRKPSRCLPGTVTMHFSPDANIYPCSHVMGNEKFIIGDVINGLDPEKINEIQNLDANQENCCEMKCDWKPMCHAERCKLVNYAINQDYKPVFSACLNEHLLLKIHGYCNQKEINRCLASGMVENAEF